MRSPGWPNGRRLFALPWLLLPVVTVVSAPPAAEGQALGDDPRVAEALHLLETWMDAEQAYEDLPGVSMAVVHDQELLWAKGFGYADRERQIPASPSTMYSICSISKLFTSVAVMQLRDEGLLSLADPVARHLDWFAIEDKYPEAGPVTVEGILTHSAGLPRESDYPYWTGPDYPFPTRQQVVERVAAQSMLYPARSTYQYSNLGLTLAGEIVAAASGTSFDQYVRRRILGPLGMDDTHTDHPDDLRHGRFATGYTARSRGRTRSVVHDYSVRGIAAAAGFVSTVEDLARFASWQFRALEGKDDGILDRNTLREMYRVHWLEPDGEVARGIGFSVWKSDDKTFVGHGGSCPGYRSHLLLRPREKVATAFMVNAQGVNASRYAQQAYDILAPAIQEALKDPEGASKPDPSLERYLGLYERPLGGESVALLWKGELAVVGLPTDDPLESMTRLQHVEGSVFRRVRSDGEPGEEIVFETDADGRMRMWRHSNYQVKVR
jgi:CubicO group peptidase (beta-lactamase class C family)